MVTSPRTYRPLATVLAFSLLLTVATPLVRHACAMAGVEMATMPCCPPGAHNAPAQPVSDAPPCHSAPAEPVAPTEPAAPCPGASDWSAMRAACCGHIEAPAAPALERVELIPAALPALLAAFMLPPEPPPPPPRVSGDPSPPAPVARHVLYERFLI